MAIQFICPNCQTENQTISKFCKECGQKTNIALNSVWRMLFDFVANIIDYDSKLFNSLRGLIKPGYLTQQYLAKKRVSFLTPIRLFLVAMLVFFGILSLQGNNLLSFDSTGNDSFINFGTDNENVADDFYSLLERGSSKLRFNKLFNRI